MEQKKIFLLTFFIIIFNINLNSSAPLWIQNPKVIYPADEYLSAVGEGRNMEEASSNAIANISKIFESNIKVDNIFNENTTQTNSETSRIINMSVNVRVASEGKLSNINIGEFWNGNGRYYVIAYLNKKETAKIYQNKIENNNEKIETLIENMGNDERPFDKYYYGAQAVLVASENDKFYNYMMLLLSPNSPPPLKYSYQSVSMAIGKMMKKISMKIVIDKKYKNVEQKISKILTGLGFSVSKKGWVNVVVDVNETLSESNGFIFSKYSFNIDVDDGNETFFTFTRSGKEGQINVDSLNRKVISKLEGFIDNEFEKEFILAFTNSLEEHN